LTGFFVFGDCRDDPGAKQTGLSERVLYNKFADFPDPMYSITQVCSLSDVRLHHGIKSQEALERLAAFRVDIMRLDLINEISSQLRRRVPNGNRQVFQKMETAINSALAFGSREAVLNGSKDASGADGLITVWDTWCSAPVQDMPGMPEARLRAEAAQTRCEFPDAIGPLNMGNIPAPNPQLQTLHRKPRAMNPYCRTLLCEPYTCALNAAHCTLSPHP
jgi:hypothetical protein